MLNGSSIPNVPKSKRSGLASLWIWELARLSFAGSPETATPLWPGTLCSACATWARSPASARLMRHPNTIQFLCIYAPLGEAGPHGSAAVLSLSLPFNCYLRESIKTNLQQAKTVVVVAPEIINQRVIKE